MKITAEIIDEYNNNKDINESNYAEFLSEKWYSEEDVRDIIIDNIEHEIEPNGSNGAYHNSTKNGVLMDLYDGDCNLCILLKEFNLKED